MKDPCDLIKVFLIILLFCEGFAEAVTPIAQGQQFASQGKACFQGRCNKGLECITFYGVAGARGPAFTSCEIPCKNSSDRCPNGQSCITIHDGPGRVCRPNLPTMKLNLK